MYSFCSCRVSDLLLGGAIMNKVLQPYESHIPYQLQVCYFWLTVNVLLGNKLWNWYSWSSEKCVTETYISGIKGTQVWLTFGLARQFFWMSVVKRHCSLSVLQHTLLPYQLFISDHPQTNNDSVEFYIRWGSVIVPCNITTAYIIF